MNTKEKKQTLLEALYEPYKKCMQCPLGSMGREKIVFGQGNPDAKLVFIGEAPGQDEDKTGYPFMGKSGQLLNKIFLQIGINRTDIFITNIAKCRPPKNRPPLPIEIKTCKTILLTEQLKIIQPKAICTLGSTAFQGLLEENIQISKIRGKIHTWKNIKIIPSYHPAFILRNQKNYETLLKDIQLAYFVANEIELSTSGG